MSVTADDIQVDARIGDGALVEVGNDAVNLRGVVMDEAMHVVIASADVRGFCGQAGCQAGNRLSLKIELFRRFLTLCRPIIKPI